MKAGRQTTLRRSTELSGIGVHSGFPVTVSIHPAEAGTGIVFLRCEEGMPDREIRASYSRVVSAELATALGDESGPAVATVEHILAALYGLGIDNAVIEIDGPEIPIMDGSAAPFVAAFDAVGVVSLPAARRYLKVLKPVGVASGKSYGELRPHEGGLRLEVEIDFDNPVVGRQSIECDVDPLVFRRKLARARTFGFTRDVERLWSAGYARGASLENTLVVGEDRVLNAGGLRFPDEFVRHKALDAVGDLALAGAPILGAFHSICGGHRLNYAVVTALLADPTAWTWAELPPAASAPLRDTVSPARAGGEMAAYVQPAFAPDLS